MSENPRDTQFAGFARLVVDQLYDAMGDWVDMENTNWRREFEQIIARRAYDLACHILHGTAYGFDLFNIPDRVNEIPDLTKLPEVKS